VTAVVPVPVEGRPLEPTPKQQAKVEAIGVRKGGWFVRITILAFVLLWLIPAAGVLITSVRPAEAVNGSGWWTVFGHPFSAASWTFENYRLALNTDGFGSSFLNSLAVAIPATVIPITIAAFAAYAFSWMKFRGRYVMFVLVVATLLAIHWFWIRPIFKSRPDFQEPYTAQR